MKRERSFWLIILRILRVCALVFLVLILVIPLPRFADPLSTVVESSDSRLLGAHIALDEQWRFPASDSLPGNYVKALISYEDRYYYYHPGINIVSLFRSLIINIREGRIVSGGSTIPMQVARLSGNNPPRTVTRKLIEMLMACKLELWYSKDEILSLYASNAPFGGNIVGIEAAAWRYFGRPTSDLSWSEAALLAVLPNAPSMLYPGKNNPELLSKRNALLDLLYSRSEIDELSLSLAKDEPLPPGLHSLPRMAPVLTNRMLGRDAGQRYRTSIEYDLQTRLLELARRNQAVNAVNEIHNMAAIIVDVETGNVLAYAGNISDEGAMHAGDVDMIQAPRSTGSILKPFLYAAMLESGELTPDMLIRDVPVEFSGYSPKNYDLKYRGAVKASTALSRSLNVPAVEMLRVYTPARFLHLLHELDFRTFGFDSDHYGLSLILGGAEASLFELTGVYARMAYTLKHYDQGNPGFPDYNYPGFLAGKESGSSSSRTSFPLSAGSIWSTFEAMQEVNRPSDYAGWKNFSSSGNIAWKTGTSFGYRDAWAIGVCPDYAIGVWAGNADGEGRTGLTGLGSAAPLLFDIIDMLNPDSWFDEPLGDMAEVEICTESGHRASPRCENVKILRIPLTSLPAPACPYHYIVHLSEDEKFRVKEGCYTEGDIIEKSWFVLPPAQEWYYKKNNYDYRSLPPLYPGCGKISELAQIELLYPRNLGGIYIPIENSGQRGRVVFEAAHRKQRERLFWHLDENYICETSLVHQVALNPEPGEHILTILDESGNTLTTRFTVIDKGE